MFLVKIHDPQFEGQTKAKLGNSEVRGAADTFLMEQLSYYFEENPKVAKVIIDKAVSSASERSGEKSKGPDEKALHIDNTTLPGKLADCQDTDITVNEIFSWKDSAGGLQKWPR